MGGGGGGSQLVSWLEWQQLPKRSNKIDFICGTLHMIYMFLQFFSSTCFRCRPAPLLAVLIAVVVAVICFWLCILSISKWDVKCFISIFVFFFFYFVFVRRRRRRSYYVSSASLDWPSNGEQQQRIIDGNRSLCSASILYPMLDEAISISPNSVYDGRPAPCSSIERSVSYLFHLHRLHNIHRSILANSQLGNIFAKSDARKSKKK